MRTTLVVIVTILLVIGANVCRSQESGASTQSTNRLQNFTTAARQALHFLKETQSQDGSWSNGVESCAATALAFSALLRSGETRMSPNFGETIISAREWLLASRPESLNDRMAVVVALSDYYTLHTDTSVVQKVTDIVQALEDPGDSVWGSILCATRLPEESQRPEWCLALKQAEQKGSLKDANEPPHTKSDYFKIYVGGRVKGVISREKASANYHYLSARVIPRQQVDGSFPVSVAEDKVVATALVVLSLADLNHIANKFLPPSSPSRKESDDTEIKVTL